MQLHLSTKILQRIKTKDKDRRQIHRRRTKEIDKRQRRKKEDKGKEIDPKPLVLLSDRKIKEDKRRKQNEIKIKERYGKIVDNMVVLTIVSLKYTVPVEYST